MVWVVLVHLLGFVIDMLCRISIIDLRPMRWYDARVADWDQPRGGT